MSIDLEFVRDDDDCIVHVNLWIDGNLIADGPTRSVAEVLDPPQAIAEYQRRVVER